MSADLLPTSRLFTLVVLCPLAVVSGRYLKNINKQKYGETAKLDLMAGILSASLSEYYFKSFYSVQLSNCDNSVVTNIFFDNL